MFKDLYGGEGAFSNYCEYWCQNGGTLVSTHRRHPHDSPMTPDKELFSNQPRNLDFLFTATFVCIYFKTFDNLDINHGL